MPQVAQLRDGARLEDWLSLVPAARPMDHYWIYVADGRPDTD